MDEIRRFRVRKQLSFAAFIGAALCLMIIPVLWGLMAINPFAEHILWNPPVRVAFATSVALLLIGLLIRKGIR